MTPHHLSIPLPSDLSATLPSSEEVSAVFEHASLGMALSRNRVIVRCNRVFAQLFGKPVVEWIGLPGASRSHRMSSRSASYTWIAPRWPLALGGRQPSQDY